VLIQMGAAYVKMDRMHSLYRVSLFWTDNVESHASRGNFNEDFNILYD